MTFSGIGSPCWILSDCPNEDFNLFIYNSCVSGSFMVKRRTRRQMMATYKKYLLCPVSISGHARFTEPPGRSTAWRFGFNTPRNDNDNELNCGGFSVSTKSLLAEK